VSVVSRAVEGVKGAVSAAGEFIAEKLHPGTQEQPRATPAVRRAARQARIKLRVGQKRRG
jgi:hypothetical protein